MTLRAERLDARTTGAATTSGIADIDTVAALLKKASTTLECELRGTSMGASMPDGSTLRVHYEDVPRYGIGDVIAFRAADGITVHRIIGTGAFGRARSYFITQGDGMLLIDHPVPHAAVLGVVREWKQGGAWRPVPHYVATGWRALVRKMWLWPVLIALHVDQRLAKAITITGFTTRMVIQRLRR